MTRKTCKKCCKSITKNTSLVTCAICNESKHPSCQNLTNRDVTYIIESGQKWACLECNTDRKSEMSNDMITSNDLKIAANCKIQCSCCQGFSYKTYLVSNCIWCNRTVHNKCNSTLGCLDCRKDMIPGFSVETWELFSDHNDRYNNLVHNPYHREHFTNLIGDKIQNKDHCDETWGDISDFLVNCKYKQFRNISKLTDSNLRILSLNIQGLFSKMSSLRDDLENFDKYDILCFNETNTVSNKSEDILLEGFHKPFIQDSLKKIGKMGWSCNICPHTCL